MKELIEKARLYGSTINKILNADDKKELEAWLAVADKVNNLLPKAEELLDRSSVVYFIQNRGRISVTDNRLKAENSEKAYAITRGHVRPITCGFVADSWLL